MNSILHRLSIAFMLSSLLGTSGALAASKTKASSTKNPVCESCLKQASLAFADKDALEALKILKTWNAACTNNTQFQLLMSSVLISLGKIEEARESAAKAVASAPESIPALMHYGLCLSSSDRFVEASQQYEKIIEVDPNNYEAWSSLGDIYDRLRQDDKSKEAKEKAALLDPHQQEIKLKTVRNLRDTGKIKEVRQQLAPLINTINKASVLDDLAIIACDVGDWRQAIIAIEKELKDNPNKAQTWHFLASAQLMAYQYENCIDSCNKVLSLDPKDSQILGIQALALIGLNKLEESNKSIERLLKIDSDSETGKYAQAKLNLVSGDLDKARQELLDVLSAEPDDMFARIDLCRLEYKLGDKAKALQNAKLVERNGSFTATGLALESQIEGSAETAQKAFDLDGQNSQALLALASSKLSQNSLEDARKYALEAIKINRAESDAQIILAKVCLAQNKKAEAIAYLEQCLKLAKNDPEALALLKKTSSP